MRPVQYSMSNYAYVAVDPQGAEARGTLDVADQSEALRRIREMGLFPTKVSARNQGKRKVRSPKTISPLPNPLPTRASRGEGGVTRKVSRDNLNFVNPPALFLLIGMAGIEDNAVAEFEGGLQCNGDALPVYLSDFAEIHAAFLAEARMHKFLIVIAVEPTGVEAARESHLHGVLRSLRVPPSF